MGVVIAFWVLLFFVLIAGMVVGFRQLDEMRRRARQRPLNPILDIKRRFDLGEITRDQFEEMIKDELEHGRHAHGPGQAA